MTMMKKTRFPGVESLSNGKYKVRITWFCPKTGKRIDRRRVIDADSPSDANAQRIALTQQAERESRERLRVTDYVQSWLVTKLPALKPATADRYATTLDLHIVPWFGDMFVDAVERTDVIKWRDAQSERYKPETVNSQLRVLRALFSDATAELGLPSDPTARVQGVRAAKTRENPNRLTAEELQRLLAAIERLELQAITQRHRTRRKRGLPAHSETDLRRLYPLFLFLAHTGVRIGEATALQWDDLDLDRMVVTVHRARWRAHVDSTKTDNLRTIPLTTALVDALHAHRARLEAVESVDVLSAGWLFPSFRTGGLLSRSVLDKPLRKALDAAAIPRRLTVHGFRRTFNNLLRQAVKGDIVRAMTGHVTERMTLHYSHIEGEEKAAAIALVFERPERLPVAGLPADPTPDRTSECNLAEDANCGTSCGTLAPNEESRSEEDPLTS